MWEFIGLRLRGSNVCYSRYTLFCWSRLGGQCWADVRIFVRGITFWNHWSQVKANQTKFKRYRTFHIGYSQGSLCKTECFRLARVIHSLYTFTQFAGSGDSTSKTFLWCVDSGSSDVGGCSLWCNCHCLFPWWHHHNWICDWCLRRTVCQSRYCSDWPMSSSLGGIPELWQMNWQQKRFKKVSICWLEFNKYQIWNDRVHLYLFYLLRARKVLHSAASTR